MRMAKGPIGYHLDGGREAYLDPTIPGFARLGLAAFRSQESACLIKTRKARFDKGRCLTSAVSVAPASGTHSAGSRDPAIDRIDFAEMSVDELWALRVVVNIKLVAKLQDDQHKLEVRLRTLRRESGDVAMVKPARRHYPKVRPKYVNPDWPNQTWAGRGKTPRWVSDLLAAGKSMSDLRVTDLIPRI